MFYKTYTAKLSMVLIEHADRTAYYILGAVYGAIAFSILTYGYLKSRPKYSNKEIEASFRRCIAAADFEIDYLVPLAVNLAVREKTPEEEFGEDIDISRISPTFNMFGETLEEFYSRNKPEKDKMKRKLNKLVGGYKIRRARSEGL